MINYDSSFAGRFGGDASNVLRRVVAQVSISSMCLRPAFKPEDPKSAKRQSSQAAFCAFGI